MSPVTASPYWTLLFVVFVSADEKTITAEPGQDVTLTCRAPNNKIIRLRWSRADRRDENVLFYRGGHFDPDKQHPSFKNRVDLQDRQMKDGDVSLILKNVTINDSGKYGCNVFVEGAQSWEIIIINLHVDPPGQPGGVIMIVCFSAVVSVVGFLIYKRKQHDSTPHNDPETGQRLCTVELNCDLDDLKMN